MTLDELIRELEELSELAASASGSEAETMAVRQSYAHATRLARLVKGASSRMKSADEYAELAERAIEAGARSAQRNDPYAASVWVGEMISLSNLAVAAAQIEAAEANYEAHKRRLLEALNEEAEDPSEADIDAFMGAIENPDADLCPGCGCTANVEHADGLVCEEYPSCGAEL